MKAWIVKVKYEPGTSVVFAETRGKAKSLARDTDYFTDFHFCDIEARRVPQIDKYYKDGKFEMDWYNPQDRLALVKELGFVCDYDCFYLEECAHCSAQKYCDLYNDRKEV